MNSVFISGITHLVFLDHGSPWVTDTRESETVEKGELLYHPVSPPTKKKSLFLYSFLTPLPLFKLHLIFTDDKKGAR